jgi:lactate permease
MFKQVFDPIAHSLGYSAIFALLPLLVIFVLLGGLRLRPFYAGLGALVTASLVAIFAYGMSIGVTLSVALYGAAFALISVLWIPINAIWIHTMMVQSGYFAVLRRSFSVVSADSRIQALLVGFIFGALLEALAGGGMPVAIIPVMLMSLGMDPLKAAVVALISDTAPVCFGALAQPIITLAQVTGKPFDVLGAIIGRQTPLVGILVPFVLIFLVDGKRGLRQTWPAALVSALSFGSAQFLCSNYFSVALADVTAALCSAGALLAFLHYWQPHETVGGRKATSVGAAAAGDLGAPVDRRVDQIVAFLPYVIIILVFTLAQVGFVHKLLAHATVRYPWPKLAIITPAGKPVATILAVNYLTTTGSLLLFAGLATIPFLKVRPLKALTAYRDTLVQLRWTIPTVMFVLGVAFVMSLSGQTITLGRFMAGAGAVAFALLSPVIGWIGVAISGSDNSANALFGALQVAAAEKLHLSPTLLAAANSSGGVLGKPISVQNLTIAAAAVGLSGREGDIFRSVFLWSLILLLAMCFLVYLQTTPILNWMVP